MKKTKKMLAVEVEQGAKIEYFLTPLVRSLGMSAAADHLGIPKSTLNYWMLMLGYRVERVVLAPGEYVEVRRND